MAAFLFGLVIPTGAGDTAATDTAAGYSQPLPPLSDSGGYYYTEPEPQFQAPFTLETSSSLGREMNIFYDNAQGGNDSAPRGTKSTWSKVIPSPTEYGSGQVSVSSSAPVSFSSNSQPQSDTVTCRITDATGKVVDEETGTGEYASASCIGY